jgi:benzoyl-CoA-dihydrodiol lyase
LRFSVDPRVAIGYAGAMAEPTAAASPADRFSFESHPSRYSHLALKIDGPVATILLDVKENQGLRGGYVLKLNSYDLAVDIELADAVQRLRFEHPEVACVVVTSAREGIFSSGANIFMLGSSTHAFKVNFCKYTNETRLAIEDACESSGQTYVAAVNGTASGGGYELPMACREIHLIDDRRSAVSLPEVPYLGVLPGTGGLTRLVDKRKVRRDRADIFSTLAEGIKGKRAVEWGLVDFVHPSSQFPARVAERARQIAKDGRPDRKGVVLDPLDPEVSEARVTYRHVELAFGPVPRTASLTVTLPDRLPDVPADPAALGASWFPLRAFRELDDALLRLRFHYPETGLVLVRTRGVLAAARALDAQLEQHAGHWFVGEVRLHIKRVLKRMDQTARSFFALVEPGSCFGGTLFELALASDRCYMRDSDGTAIALTPANGGPYPMSNGLSRLATRFLGEPQRVGEALARSGSIGPGDAADLGLVTDTFDEIDWEDEIRLAVEERASLSPDALTGMEANLRFAGPETMETKIFGRLSAWQNWIFQRPNAVGEQGALTLYGQPQSAVFDYRRT